MSNFQTVPNHHEITCQQTSDSSQDSNIFHFYKDIVIVIYSGLIHH